MCNRLVLGALLSVISTGVVDRVQSKLHAECDAPPTSVMAKPSETPWSLDAEILLMKQVNEVDSLSLVRNASGSVTLLNAEDFDGHTEAGPRLTLTRHCFPDSACHLEFGYFGVDGLDDSRSFPAAGSLYMLTADSDFAIGPVVADANIRYGTSLQSFEVNIRRDCYDRFDGLIGFRLIDYEEGYGIDGNFISAGLPPVDAPFVVSVDTNNYLWGPQIGGEFLMAGGGCLDASVFGKGGLCVNSAQGSNRVRSPVLPLAGLSDRRSETGLAGFIETGVQGRWYVNDWLMIHGGYQLLWLEGLALAPTQIPLTQTAGPQGPTFVAGAMDVDGGSLFHGGFVGIAIRL